MRRQQQADEKVRELEQEVEELQRALMKCRVNARMIAAGSPSVETKRIIEIVNRAVGDRGGADE
jgi:Tfp pilus assembly PilM family ATPase